MQYATTTTDDGVTLNPAGAPRASVIWLHGLGADGFDFLPIVPELRLPPALGLRFVFPHAQVRPVTLNNGYRMRAWYDIRSLTAAGRVDAEGVEASVARILTLIESERSLGIAPSRIALVGFSQGGAIALHAALTAPERLAGAVGLSTYLPLADTLAARRAAANAGLPVLMCHGTNDAVIAISMGLAARDALQAAGYAVEWHEYPMAHEVSAAELGTIARWLEARLA